MKEQRIKVLALLPMELPKEIELDNALEAMQKFVGGLIECITLSDTGSEVTLVCNDEGKLLGLPLNRPLWDGADVLAGPGFLAGCDNEGNLTSLPQSAMDFYKEKFRAFIIEIYPDTIRTTLAELLLYDWFRSARALQIPIVIMVDEVQNLRLGRGTILNRIITEGRKFSIGSILISQSLKGFAPDEQLALSQTGTKLFFKPPLTEIRACSEMLAEPVRRSGTVELLKKLKVGQCLLLSDFTYIGDSLQPSSDCIQVSISLPTSIIK